MDSKQYTRMLAADWRNAGISKGDTVLVHSDIRRCLIRARHQGVKLTPAEILASFVEAVGEQGTLLLPTFNFDFTTTKEFDLTRTPSQMGSLTEFGRTDPRFVRTGHPVYSFVACGAHKSIFESIDNKSAYGADSPFAALLELGGKVAVLDLQDQDSMTFYHHVEELHDVDYRYHKNFSGTYIDRQGVPSERDYSIFVRDLERGILTSVNRMGDLLWKLGVYSGDKPKQGSGLRVALLSDVEGVVSDIIEKGKSADYLYEIEK